VLNALMCEMAWSSDNENQGEQHSSQREQESHSILLHFL
jgi:hypothetical protein